MSSKPFLFFVVVLSLALFSCDKKTKHGDFTLITQKDKYEALGGALKIDGYTLQYKGQPIDWAAVDKTIIEPNIEEFRFISNASNIITALVEVQSKYYLLVPNGDNVDIKFLADAATSAGVFNSKPYTELLGKNEYFHQAGLLINLQTFKRDSLLFTPAGRFFGSNEDVSKIIYLNGVFEDDTDLKKTLDKANEYSRTGVYPMDLSINTSTISILEWDVKNSSAYEYSYTDTSLWNKINSYYDENKGLALSSTFNGAKVFNLFEFAKDSAGVTRFIPKNILTPIAFSTLNLDGSVHQKNIDNKNAK
jgi:hypothetical protein